MYLFLLGVFPLFQNNVQTFEFWFIMENTMVDQEEARVHPYFLVRSLVKGKGFCRRTRIKFQDVKSPRAGSCGGPWLLLPPSLGKERQKGEGGIGLATGGGPQASMGLAVPSTPCSQLEALWAGEDRD